MQIFYYNIEEIGEYLGKGRYLLVCGNSFDNMYIKKYIEKFDIIRFSKFSSNPRYEDVVAGVQKYIKNACSGIIAVGGGSAIDVAKCIKIFKDMDEKVNYLEQVPLENINVPFIAIPTTAGTGSESTKHAVIYYKGVKQSLSYKQAVPEYVVLLPKLLENLPVYQKKSTLLDAFCQAIESWWSVNSTTESIVYAKRAIVSILNNYEKYLMGDEYSAKLILEAANNSGKAINITATTAPHAMSYKITSLYGIPHGIAVALCLPEIWEYMLMHLENCTDKRGEKYLQKVFTEIPINPIEFRRILKKMNICYPISEDKTSDLIKLTDSVNAERLKNNPVELTSETLFEIYNNIIKEV